MNGNFLKISLIALLGAWVGTGLTQNARAANVVGGSLKQGAPDSGYFQVTKNDAAMHLAVREARKTIKNFIAALRHPAPGQQDFELKKRFVQGDEVEHIWLSDVQLVGNHFQGHIDNQPRKIQGLKLGQIVSVKRNEISDWLYIDNGTLVGGYTVRAHYNELTPQQKQEFDRDADFKIGKP
jgi:uncharacterized protein YegJ (DUF2314 family)